MRSLDIQKELGVEPLFIFAERTQLRFFGHLIRMPSGLLCTSNWEGKKALWQALNTLSWEHLEVRQEGPEDTAMERDMWTTLLILQQWKMDV